MSSSLGGGRDNVESVEEEMWRQLKFRSLCTIFMFIIIASGRVEYSGCVNDSQHVQFS